MLLRASLLIITLLLGCHPAQAEERRMNVLMLMIDDLNTWMLGDQNRYTGTVIAPHLTKLADSGVNFTQAFTVSPLCCPSRTALISGVAPWVSGIYGNGVDANSPALQNITTLPDLFQQHGYRTAAYGKITHGFDSKSGWDHKVGHKRDPYHPKHPLNGFGKGQTDWGATHLPEAELNDTMMADLAIQQLEREHDQPFFIACGMFAPHLPWYVPQKYLDMYPPDQIQLPPLQDGDLDDVPAVARELVNESFHNNIISADHYAIALQAYLASTTYADAQLGRVLAALEQSPHKDNTIVVMMSDHGFHLGEKGHWRKGTLWEEATNSLLMFKVPGVTQAQQTCTQPVTLLNIYPTLAELAGLPAPDHLDGVSLAPLLTDPQAAWTTPALTAIHGHITVRTEDYRFIRYTDGSTELYDRGADPNEWTNQSANPEYDSVAKKLAALLPAQEAMATPRERKKRNKK